MKQIDRKRIMTLVEDERARLDLRKLARALHVSTGTIENWRLGIGNIKPENIEKIADYFGLHPLELYEGADPIPKEQPHDPEIDRLSDMARQLKALSIRRFYAAVDYLLFQLQEARKEPKDEGGANAPRVITKVERHLGRVEREKARPRRKATGIADEGSRGAATRAVSGR